MSSRTGPEAARTRRARGTQAPAGSGRKLRRGPGRRRGPRRRPRPPSPQPGLARRPSPWKPGVDSAVNMNFPSSRRPSRRLPAPRPGLASEAAFPASSGARLPLGNPEPPATLRRAASDSGEPRAARARQLRPALVRPLRESPGRRRDEGLKEPRPAGLQGSTGSRRLGPWPRRRGRNRGRRDWTKASGGGEIPLGPPLFQEPSPPPC